jgi:hypothetical protein
MTNEKTGASKSSLKNLKVKPHIPNLGLMYGRNLTNVNDLFWRQTERTDRASQETSESV